MLHLSTTWQIVLGFVLLCFSYYLLHKITVYLKDLFRPFKKGKRYWCRVSAVSDGDTLTCYRFNIRRSETKLRFAYVDAPESSQAYGKESLRLVQSMVKNKMIRVQITDIDRYGRCVGVVYRYRKNINEEIVKRGAAWVYEEYIRDKNHLRYMMELQNKAKKQKKGLWKNSRPVRPSVYRKQIKAAS
ncbi:thermonuclease family protein [Acinetobacter variabilis]|uniref:thermonuclease family protein n=1 Tax=Acinetobacter variabilis TaxID=70346 RepID=UPI00289898CB|nr:thermonuclease family protein [Acinetobacter variabilis]